MLITTYQITQYYHLEDIRTITITVWGKAYYLAVNLHYIPLNFTYD